jgi:hypothetical protein
VKFTLLETQDGGQTWIDRSVPGAKVTFRNLYFDSTQGCAAGNVTADLSADTGAEFYATTNSGQTWELRKSWGSELRNARLGYANGTAYIVGGDFASGDVARILASSNGGLAWTEVLKDTTPSGSLLAFFQLDATHMWAAHRDFYYFQYSPSHTPVLEVAVYDSVAYGGTTYRVPYLAYDIDSGDWVTVTLDYGVTPSWLTVDSANSQLAGVVPEAMVGSYFSFRIVATDSHGDTTSFTSNPVRVDHPSKVETIKELAIPLNFSLSQNYSNPFNPSTTIRYSIPKPSEVHLSVYNLLGQEIATLVNERQQGGWYEATFDVSALPSGPYFYSLRVGSFSQTRKMLVVR